MQLPPSHPRTLVAGNMVGGWFAASTLPPSYSSVQATWLVVGLQLPTSHPLSLSPSYPSAQATWLVVALQLPPSHPHTAVCRQPGWWLVCSFHPPTLQPAYCSAQATWLVVGLQLPPSHPHTLIPQSAGNLVGGWFAASTLPPSNPHTAVRRQPGWWLVCSFQPPALPLTGNLVGGWFAATTLPHSYHSAQATWLVVGFSFQLPPSNPPTLIPQCAGNLVGGWFAASTLPPSSFHPTHILQCCRQPGWWLVCSFHPPTLQPSYCSVQATWLVVGLQLPPSHPCTLIPQCAGNLVGGWFAASTLPPSPSYCSAQATWLVVGLQLPPSHPHPHTRVCRQPGWWLVCSFHPPTLHPSYCSAQAT